MTVRNYAVLYLNGRRTRSGVVVGGTIIGGGNGVLDTQQHALDGMEHAAASDLTRLNASTTAHGLLAKLSGDALEFLNGDGDWAIPAGAGALPWFVVTDPAYGAANDATTVDTAAINAAIAAYNAAGGGVLYLPGGAGYLVNGSLTALTAPGLVLGDGGSASNPATLIIQTATTVHTFTQAAHGITFRGIRGERSGAASTAGSFIHVTVGDRGFYEDCSASGFWRNIDFEDGAEWFMHGCHWTDAVKHNARIAHTDLVDGGDWTMLGCHFGSVVGTEASIRYESGGGGKIIGCKFNGGGTRPVLGVDIAYATGVQSSVILIQGNSLENMSSDAIKITTTGTGRLGHIAITGNQFGLYDNNAGRCVKIAAAAAGGWLSPHDGTISNVVIDGNVAHTDGTARAALEFTNGDIIVIGELALSGFNARYTSSGTTNITDTGAADAPVAADYLVGTAQAGLSAEIVVGATPGGELGGTWGTPTVDATHSGSAHVTALDGLSDVTITSPVAADRLRYNGSAWVNSALHWEPMVDYDGLVMLDSAGGIHVHEVTH